MRKNVVLWALLLTTVSVFLTQCKSDKVSRGNSVTVRLTGEPDKLNPLLTEEANAVQVMSNIFLSLLDFDPNTLELVPVLAKTRPSIAKIDTGALKGGTAITYEIRNEAQWDNGSPVTAADYVFTVKAILNKKAGANNYRSTIDFIKDIVVDAANPKKFTILTDKSTILAETATGSLPVLPEYAYDTEGSLKATPVATLAAALKDTSSTLADNLAQFAVKFQDVKFAREPSGVMGCGAYALAEWTPNQRVVLKKKANWWGNALSAQSPYLAAMPDELVFKPVKDEATVLSMLKNEELDVVSRIPTKPFLELQKNDSTKNAYAYNAIPSLSIVYVGLNCKNPVLSDKTVRRALAHFCDVPAYVKTIMSGFAEPCAGPFVPQREYYNKELTTIPLDVEKAKALLTAAGWKDTNGDSTLDKRINGKPTELVLRFAFAAQNGAAKNIGLMMQEEAKKAGVKIELQPLEGKVLSENLKKRDFDMWANSSGFPPSLDDPKELWATSSNTPDGGNRFQFENKQADALMEQIRGELDAAKRNQLYKDFQKLIYDEQPAIFLFSTQDRLAIHKRFKANTYPRRPGYILGQFTLSGQ